MATSVSDLLRQHDEIETQVTTRVNSSWCLLQEELGIPEDLIKAEAPRVKFSNAAVGIEVSVRSTPRSGEKGRTAFHQFQIPAGIFDKTGEEARLLLRETFPLVCTQCGLVQPPRSTACRSSAGCWGRLVWRSVAPRPLFYAETRAGWGYFKGIPGPRGLRYVIDLTSRELCTIQWTLRNREKWVLPVPEIQQKIYWEVAETVGVELDRALASAVTKHADPACFTLERPEWSFESVIRALPHTKH